MNKNEAQAIHKGLIVTQSRHNMDPSGIVVLFISIYNPIKSHRRLWIDDDKRRLEKCKPNITVSFSHYGSSGYVASFGNKGSFDKAVVSSVGQYSTKKSKNQVKQLFIEEESQEYENLIAIHIAFSVKDLSVVIPNIRTILNPIVKTAFEIQQKDKELNIKEGKATVDGCWHTSICINAETKCFHTEEDCSYTLITVPQQNVVNDRYDFIFQLKGNKHINLHMLPGTSFIFSGMYLTHRQNRLIDTNSNEDNEHFFNIASYGNKRLFSHIRSTLKKLN